MPRLLDVLTPPPAAAGRFDLNAFGATLKRRRLAWLVPTSVTFLAAALFVTLVTPRFTAESRIELDRAALGSDAAGQVDEGGLARQEAMIRSPETARRVIKALHLEGNPELDPLAKGMNPLSRGLVLLGALPDPTRKTAEARMVGAFESKLQVLAEPKRHVITVAFTSRDRDLAARVSNEIVTVYLQERSAASGAVAKAAVEGLATRIAALRSKLADADAARERARSSAGSSVDGVTGDGQSLAALTSELARAHAEQDEAQTKAANVRNLLRDGRAADIADISNSSAVRQLASQRAETQAQLAQESRTLLPEHPRIKELNAQLREYDAAFKATAKQVELSLESDAKAAAQRVTDLEAALGQRKKLASAQNGDAGQLDALDRVAGGLRDQLRDATTKYQEASSRQSASPSPAGAHVISRAEPPHDPSFPKRLPILFLTTLAALILSVGLVALRELLSRRTRTIVDTQRRAMRPASQARQQSSAEPQTRKRDHSNAADELRSVRTGGNFWSEAPHELPESGADAMRTTERDPRSLSMPLRAAADGSSQVDGAGRSPPATVGPIGRFRHRFETASAGLMHYLGGFGRPAAVAEHGGTTTALSPVLTGTAGVGWDGDVVLAEEEAIAQSDTDDAATLADHIVEGHVPGRGLHVVATGIGTDAMSSYDLLALARALAERGRTIVVDLGTTPARLAPLAAVENGRAVVMTLDGLSELLANESSFAEVIHRDQATRLHFIPAGRKDADFRDFDLILDALTETYDFIVLLTPAFPQSEIAKVMAPYADFVVLSAKAEMDVSMLAALEAELTGAGAREVLVSGRRYRDQTWARVVA